MLVLSFITLMFNFLVHIDTVGVFVKFYFIEFCASFQNLYDLIFKLVFLSEISEFHKIFFREDEPEWSDSKKAKRLIL